MMNSKLNIKNLTLNNRFCRSATWEGLADAKGWPTEKLTNLFTKLAENECGLIITGLAAINEQGRTSKNQLILHSDEVIEPLKELTSKVKKYGAVIGTQIAHGGAVISSKYLKEDEKPVGPSEILDLKLGLNCRGFSTSELKDLVANFAKAAQIAHKSGFEVIQLHGAHGYLLSQFLSPVYNRRTDAYGGKALNRGRIIFEILEAIRAKLGEEVVLSIKINNQDYFENGLTIEDSRLICEELVKNGLLDMVEVSGGLAISGALGPIRPKPETINDEGVFKEASKYFKEKIKVPVYVVGAMRSLETVNNILENKYADGVAFSRPLIREPNLFKRWLNGESEKAQCISCNACFKAALKENNGIYCPLVEKT